ncbi:MAG: hypothetical protein DRQ10_00345 [Candidatus Hydrothermota bacterium]|nr:MAG: hypothetical protein DRQ10_00345 [Candidatus Hydrothermae bacterium]
MQGVYGAPKGKNSATNAEIVASLSVIKPGDFIFFYVKNVGIYGVWKVISHPFYDETPIYSDRVYPYRILFEPVIREFEEPILLHEILDLRDKGKIWTFDMGMFTKKNHFPITSQEGIEILRLLLRNNPVFKPVRRLKNPYRPINRRPLWKRFEFDSKGRFRYEGHLNAWLAKSFVDGELRDVFGDYFDVINYVPTSFNKIMDFFLTHVTRVDSIDILHKFTCLELKTGTVKEKDLEQLIRYENWIARKLADGDFDMVQSILIGFDFDDSVIEFVAKRNKLEHRKVRLLKYEVMDISLGRIALHEIN